MDASSVRRVFFACVGLRLFPQAVLLVVLQRGQHQLPGVGDGLGDVVEQRRHVLALGVAVGGAVGWNPIGIIIPCHRVIGANGSLTGYGGGIANKIALLAHEGNNQYRSDKI